MYNIEDRPKEVLKRESVGDAINFQGEAISELAKMVDEMLVILSPVLSNNAEGADGPRLQDDRPGPGDKVVDRIGFNTSDIRYITSRVRIAMARLQL